MADKPKPPTKPAPPPVGGAAERPSVVMPKPTGQKPKR